MYIHVCPLCATHATHEYHSTYKGHPIEFGTSWITKKRHYHSNDYSASTLQEVRDRITQWETSN